MRVSQKEAPLQDQFQLVPSTNKLTMLLDNKALIPLKENVKSNHVKKVGIKNLNYDDEFPEL